MERTEQLLREELRRDGGPTPDRDAMLAGVARARRRRTAAVTGAALAVAGLVGAAVLTTTGWPAAGTQAGSELGNRLYSNQLINVVFTDTAHGYAIQQYCSADNVAEVPSDGETPDLHEECANHLVATADGGRTWEQRAALPGDPATKDAGVDIVLGRSLMLWRNSPATIALGGRNLRYWISSNGGQSWTESASPRDVPPAGGAAWFGPHDEMVFLTTSPPQGYAPDGSKLRLGPKNPLTVGSDGSFWLACPGGPCVQLTRDQGATWQTPTPLATATTVDWVSTFDGQTAYAGVFSESGGARLTKTTDGGLTWTEVSGLTGLPDRTADGLVLPGGDLLLTRPGEQGGMYRLTAGSTAIEPVAGAPTHPNAFYLTGGVIVAAPAWDQRTDPDVAPVAWTSDDNGETWRPIPPQ